VLDFIAVIFDYSLLQAAESALGLQLLKLPNDFYSDRY
jgi:hypothetical protein